MDAAPGPEPPGHHGEPSGRLLGHQLGGGVAMEGVEVKSSCNCASFTRVEIA